MIATDVNSFWLADSGFKLPDLDTANAQLQGLPLDQDLLNDSESGGILLTSLISTVTHDNWDDSHNPWGKLGLNKFDKKDAEFAFLCWYGVAMKDFVPEQLTNRNLLLTQISSVYIIDE